MPKLVRITDNDESQEEKKSGRLHLVKTGEATAEMQTFPSPLPRVSLPTLEEEPAPAMKNPLALGGPNRAYQEARAAQQTPAVTPLTREETLALTNERRKLTDEVLKQSARTDADWADIAAKQERMREITGVLDAAGYKAPTLWERMKNIVTGAAKSTASSDVEAAALLNQAAGPGNDKIRQAQAEAGAAYGDGFMGTLARQLINNTSSGNAQTDVYQNALRSLDDDVAPQLYETADKIGESAAADISRAQEGTNGLERMAVNAGVAGVQMAGDIITGAGNTMVPMMIRSFGGGAQEARRKGYSTEQQLALGLTSAATEYFSEKLFGGNPVYDKKGALIDTSDMGLVNKAINAAVTKFAGTDRAKKLMAVLGSTAAETLNEGWEEVVSDLLNPLWEQLIAGNKSEVELQGLVESWIVGAALGAVGQGGNAVINRIAGTNAAKQGAETQEVTAETQNPTTESETEPGRTAEQTPTASEAEGLSLPEPEGAQKNTAPVASAVEGAVSPVQDAGQRFRPMPGKSEQSLGPTATQEVKPSVAEETAKGKDDLEFLVKNNGRDYEKKFGPQAAEQKFYDAITAGDVKENAGGDLYVTKAEDHIDNRDMASVSPRSVKSFQYLNPEVHPYYAEVAQVLMNELRDTQKPEMIRIPEGRGENGVWQPESFYRTSRQTTPAIAELRDDYNISYADIEKALQAIIDDKGADNIAVAKRVELLIDEMLENDYFVESEHQNLSGFIDVEAYKQAKDAIRGAQAREKYAGGDMLADVDALPESVGEAMMQQLTGETPANIQNGGLTYEGEQTAGTEPAAGAEQQSAGSLPLPDGDAGRRGAERFGERAGRVPSTVRNTGGTKQNREAAQQRQLAVESEPLTSPAEIGFPDGSEEATCKLYPEVNWDEETRAAVEWAGEKGVEVVPVVGLLQNSAGDSVVGAIDKVTGRVWVRADSASRSLSETVEHEVGHRQTTENMVRAFMERIQQGYKEGAWRMIYEAYKAKYAGLTNDYAGMTEDQIDLYVWEEIMEDAYSDTNRFGTKAGVYSEDAYEIIEADGEPAGLSLPTLESEAPASQATGAAGNRGPPERYSFGGRNANKADLDALAEAERLEMQGVDDETIRQMTGWFRGMEGKWRFEIDDSKMEYRPGGDASFKNAHPDYAEYWDLMNRMLSGELLPEADEARLQELDEIWGHEYGRLHEHVTRGNATLEDIIDRPELFGNYPQLGSARVRFEELPTPDDEERIFRAPGGVEVVQNPTDREYQQMREEILERYPQLRGTGEPLLRRTFDEDGNVYYWDASRATHARVEPEINRRYNTRTNQQWKWWEKPDKDDYPTRYSVEDGNLYRPEGMSDEEYNALNESWRAGAERHRPRIETFDNVDDYARDVQHRAEERRAERMAKNDKASFTGTPALQKLGVKVDGSVGNYANIDQLKAFDKSAKQLRNATKRAERRLGATSKEKSFASGISAGVYSQDDIPKTMDAEKVLELADYYTAEGVAKNDLIRNRRAEINRTLDEKMETLFKDSDKFKPGKMLTLNYRTPRRNILNIFGDERGQEIVDYLIDPIQTNEAENIRFKNRMFDEAREFTDSKGKQSKLTDRESAVTQMVMEGKVAAETVAGMQMREAIESTARNLKDGKGMSEAMGQYVLNANEQKLAEQYARWLEAEEAMESGKVDSVKVNNAAEKLGKMYGDFYDAINDFLIAHGYEPIGFIRGYAPHMQPEETVDLFTKALDSLGVGGADVATLPASIAGLTASYKPNMRWNPHFQHRVGDTTKYDAMEGFENYVEYMGDILYHTDDVMKLRRASSYFRTTYAPEEIKENISWAKELRYGTTEEKENMLRDNGQIDRSTVMTDRDIDAKLDEYVEKLIGDVKVSEKYSNFVMWLDNYANILAGKQSMADRGQEYQYGRKVLNIGNKLNRTFSNAKVAGNMSSVLNQAAQLPQIVAENGAWRSGKAFLQDVFGGEKFRSWAQDSDFLTEKKGLDYLVMDKGEKILNGMFAPASFMDGLMSTVAVRGRYLKEVKNGKSHAEAMKIADEYGRSVMGSRAKGSAPLAFHAKNPVARMVNVFQIEALNSWEHLTQDLPRDVRTVEKEHGKAKAASYLAGIIVKTLLGAFFLNRLDEELYGGTPAPFDILGLSANFIASGEGLTTNAYLKTVIDNGLEALGGERLFDTDKDKIGNKPFDWETAADDLGYNVMNDVPFVRNVAGILGLGDQTVPLPNVGKGVEDIKSAAKDDGLISADTGKALLGLAAELVPGGAQLKKTVTAIEYLNRGGDFSGSGDKERLKYPADMDFASVVQAMMFGKYATQASDEFYASGRSALSAKQTQLWRELKESGVDGKEAYEVIQQYREAEDDEEKRSAVVNGLDWTDAQKMQLWNGLRNASADWDDSKAKAAGVSTEVYIRFQTETKGFTSDKDGNGKTISGSKKQKVVNYINGLPISAAQKDALYYDAGYAESKIDETPWHELKGVSLPGLAG